MESDIKIDNIKWEIENNSIRVKEFDTKKGGIYLEITDDPRGWMLGDKTRRIYKSTIAQVALLTNLLVKVYPHRNRLIALSSHRNGITVKVYNPGEVGRMLVCLNDDVGSSIEYAKHDDSKPLELSAEMGQHICIEPMANNNRIRVQIFPGENVKKYYVYIEKGDKFVHLSNDSKFSNNVMTVTEVKKDNRFRERDDIIYFNTEYPVDNYTKHDARAWWFLDNCIKVR